MEGRTERKVRKRCFRREPGIWWQFEFLSGARYIMPWLTSWRSNLTVESQFLGKTELDSYFEK